MATTAVSTLVLALQARNETQAAFAEIRSAMQEQVTEARTAAAEQQTAARSAAAQQLTAVRDGLAQQTLAARQASEQRVAAIKAGADQQAATLRAAASGQSAQQRALADQLIAQVRADQDAQTLAVQQAYEQQALAAKTSADQQALAIKTGLATQFDEIKANLAAQVDAQKAASAQQIQTVRAQAAEEAAALRAEAAEAAAAAGEGGTAGRAHPLLGALSRVPVIGEPLAGVGENLSERMEGPLEFAKSAIGITAGLAAISAVVEGVHELPKAFSEAATAGEQFQTQMTNFYGTMQNAGQVLEFTNQEAAKMPFSLDSIRSAVAGLSETGQNVQQLLPALGNIAAAMHTDLPTAVGVFNRALLTGNMRGLVSQLHLSKAELEGFGLQVTSKGTIITSTLAPALERLAAAQFGDAMQRQSETAQGGLQRLSNMWDLFKETAGEGLFAGLKSTLETINQWLQTHQGAVQAFAEGVGRALAGAVSAAVGFAQTFGPPILAAIDVVVAAWNGLAPAISVAVTAIRTAMDTIGTFLRNNVLPVVAQALGQIVTWWNQNKDQIASVLNVIIGAVSIFVGTLQQNLAVGLNVVQGIWNVGWSLISGSMSVVLDVMTLNWRKFGNDLNNMATGIAVGVLQIFQGMVDKTIQIIGALGPQITTLINTIEHALYSATAPFADELYGMATLVQVTWDKMLNVVITNLNKLIKPLTDTHGLLYKIAEVALPKPLAESLRFFAQPGGYHLGTVALPTAADVRKNEQAWVNTLSLGFRPNVNLSFGQTADQAQAAFDAQANAWIKQIESAPNLFTGKPSTYGTPAQNQATGKAFMDQLDAWLKKYGIQFKPGKGGEADISFPNLSVGGAGGGGGAGTGPSSKDLQAALTAANDRFQLLLEKGPVTWAAGLKDIADIARAAHNAGQSNAAVTLDVLRDTKSLIDKLLGQAQKRFDFDAGVAHPDVKKLHQDENNYLALMAKTPGITPLDLSKERQDLDARIAQITGAKSGATGVPIAPVPRYGALAGETGYGGVTVSFGGAQVDPVQQMVAALREQISHLRAQLAKDDQVIALLELSNSGQGQQLGVLRTIAGGIARIPVPPGPAGARSAHSVLKAAGSYAPVTR